jgi:hypothetical protein
MDIGQQVKVLLLIFLRRMRVGYETECGAYSGRKELKIPSLIIVYRRGIILKEANQMSVVFRTIDPPPLTARRVCTPPPLMRGDDTLAGRSIVRSEDARHCSVLNICEYFVQCTEENGGTFLVSLSHDLSTV